MHGRDDSDLDLSEGEWVSANNGQAGGPTKLMLNRESVAAVQLQLLWSPSGPGDLDADDAAQCRVLAHGSGFLYRIDRQDFLVTARHNLTGRHWQTNACLGYPPVEPTHLRMAFLPQTPPEGWPISVEHRGEADVRPVASLQIRLPIYTLALLGEDWKPLWLQHPHYGYRMDVAAMSVKMLVDEIFAVPWEPPQRDPTLWTDIGAGDDVLVVGYPYGLSNGPLLPLWIRGTIATEPTLGFRINGEDLPMVLIDARTRKGQSGSAVMRRCPRGTPVFSTGDIDAAVLGHTLGPRSELVGVYSGRTSDESDLGYVWLVDEVDMICRSGVAGTVHD
jgi:hypothetical protein